MTDWTDTGWLDFESRMMEGDETRSQVLLLKEAWLHGARTALDHAQKTLFEKAKDATP